MNILLCMCECIFTHLLAELWPKWSVLLQTTPTFLLTSVTPMSPRWLGSFLLSRSLTWGKIISSNLKEEYIMRVLLRIHRGYIYKSACDALTFAPTALPRLMAFFSLCCPPEDGESMKVELELELADAEERRVECWPVLEVWGLCFWAMEFSNKLWSTEKKERKERVLQKLPQSFNQNRKRGFRKSRHCKAAKISNSYSW